MKQITSTVFFNGIWQHLAITLLIRGVRSEDTFHVRDCAEDSETEYAHVQLDGLRRCLQISHAQLLSELLAPVSVAAEHATQR